MAAALKQAPGLKHRPGFVNLIARQLDPLDFYLKLARKYGDLVYLKMGPVEGFLVNHPDYIRDILVVNQKKFGRPVGAKILSRVLLGNGLLTSEGEFHLRQRRMMQPAFHRQRIAVYARVMSQYAVRTSERWQRLPESESLDIAEEMMRLTLAVVGKTLFDADVEKDAAEVGAAMEEVISIIDHTMSPLNILFSKLGFRMNQRFAAARATLDTIVYRIINERRQTGEDRGDLLSTLLLAVDEEGGTGGMTDEQVRDEALTLFLAGHETTALGLTWTWYLLSQHPEVEAKLHAELDETLGGRVPGFEDIPRLRYTEMVFAESLRLYPPAWLFGRGTLVDQELAGYHIPARSTIFISPYVVHRDPRYYPDPLKFDPERWTPEAKESRPKFAYLPFGGGNRVCIGEGFAWTEAVLIIATLAQKWRLRLAPGHPVEPKAMLTLRPKYGMKMHLEPRVA